MNACPKYDKLRDYFNEGSFTFDPATSPMPTVGDFEEKIGERLVLVGECVLNTPQNLSRRDDAASTKKKRTYFNALDPTFDGKKVDYVGRNASWHDANSEWLYCLAYDDRIVKIGMTITSLATRWCGSYSCGTERAMEKGTCSTTNYIISECNFQAVCAGKTVEIYGIPCPKAQIEETRFGVTHTVSVSKVRDYETMLTEKFRKEYGGMPVLCVQKGKCRAETATEKKAKKTAEALEVGAAVLAAEFGGRPLVDLTENELRKLKVDTLKKLVKMQNLKVSGKKDDLVRRLLGIALS